jgi:hypothetical protein
MYGAAGSYSCINVFQEDGVMHGWREKWSDLVAAIEAGALSSN